MQLAVPASGLPSRPAVPDKLQLIRPRMLDKVPLKPEKKRPDQLPTFLSRTSRRCRTHGGSAWKRRP